MTPGIADRTDPKSHHTAAPWSFTIATEPCASDEAMVVYALPLRALGIDDLIAVAVQRAGPAEGRRWGRARAQEYATRLRDALRRYLSTAEVIVHVAEHGESERLQVTLDPKAGSPESSTLAEDLASRVDAIRKRTWVTWHEGLRATEAALAALEEPHRAAG